MEQPTFFRVLAYYIQYIIFDKFSANSFQIKLKDRSTVTNLLDKELLKYVIKKSKKRSEEE